MNKIINISQLNNLVTALHRNNKKIVLVGGCFDILHIGHVKFLRQAKSFGDILMIFLESDDKVKKLKGRNRPIFNQRERAQVLTNLIAVDYVILLPEKINDKDYENLVLLIKPSVIAVTENDSCIERKKKQAELAGAALKIVALIQTFSSSKLAKLIGVD